MTLHASRALRLLGLGALLASAASVVPTLVPAAQAATANVPVVLPGAQRAEEWAEALAARGLVAVNGLPGAGPAVLIVDKGDYWEMVVRDRKGGTQTVNVAPALSASEREDLLFYLGTLLGPAPEPAAPAVATVPPPVVVAPAPAASGTSAPASKPAATASTAPASKPAAPASTATASPATASKPAAPASPATASPATASKPAAPASTAPATASKPAAATSGASAGSVSTEGPPGESGLWLGGGGGIGVRPEVGVVGDFRVDGGWHVTPAIRVGVGVAGRTNAALAGEGRAMSDLDFVAQGAWVAGMRIAPVVGVYGGVSARTFTEDGTTVTDAMVPILGGELGVQVPLGKLPLHLEPSVRVQGDLREVQLLSELGATTLSPVEVRAGLLIGYRAR